MKHIYEGVVRNAAYEGLYSEYDDQDRTLDDVIAEACGVDRIPWKEDGTYGRVRITVEQLEGAE